MTITVAMGMQSMELFLHETATFRSSDPVPGPEAIREYLESPAINADDHPAFTEAFSAARSHAPDSLGRLLVRRYYGAVYGDAGCVAWMLTVTGIKLLAIVGVYLLLNPIHSAQAALPFAGWGVALLAVGSVQIAISRRRNRADCRELLHTLKPLAERDPETLVVALPLLEHLASARSAGEATRVEAAVVAARVRASVRSELPVVATMPDTDARSLPLSLGEIR